MQEKGPVIANLIRSSLYWVESLGYSPRIGGFLKVEIYPSKEHESELEIKSIQSSVPLLINKDR